MEVSHCNSVQSKTNDECGKGKPRIDRLMSILNTSKDELSSVEYEKVQEFL